MITADVNFEFAEWAEVPYNEAARYKVVYGGRGSGKSWDIARILILLAMQCKLKVLCAREFQMSISDSVHTLLDEQIQLLELWGWVVDKTSIRFVPTGSEFIFSGLWQNVQKIQSMEGINICWVEEAQRVSDNSWKVLIPTIRKAWTGPHGEVRDAEIWMTLNPVEEDDPTAQRFLLHPPPNTIQIKVNWQDNPWLPKVLKDEAEHLRRTDPEEYYHIWEGEFWSRSDAQIFKGKWVIDYFTPGDDWIGPYHGIDFGFSTTPTCIGRQWVYKDKLYVEEAYGGLNIDTVDLPAQLDRLPNSKELKFRCDSARPETISFLYNAGYDAIGVEKGQGSVEDGISFLRSFQQIVVHPSAKMAEHDLRAYKYKVDKRTGDVLKEIVKKHDDWPDQCRYALEPFIKGKAGSMNDLV